ncbi:MAG: STAS domain-containing protein [Ignavibacterium sp.]|nr:MAG: STAS domain-containing protein [Ignavibacterium sp.]
MDDFETIYLEGVYVIAVNVCRSTIKEASAFRKIVEQELNSGHTKLVIDLSKCVHIDSTFFGSIIKALNLTSQIGEKLKVVKPANTKEDIFLTTNTLDLFDLYKTREDAIKSYEIDSQANN